MGSETKWKLHPLGYSQFLTMFADEIPSNGKDWPTIGFTLKSDGIWVTPDELFLPTNQELADWYSHPDNDVSKPALSFPCDYNQACTFFNWLKHLFKTFEIIGLDEDWKKEYEEWLSWQEEIPKPTSSTTNEFGEIKPPRTRIDYLTSILYPILEKMYIDKKNISTANVMQELKALKCIESENMTDGIIWKTAKGSPRKLNDDALLQRIIKWKKLKSIEAIQ